MLASGGRDEGRGTRDEASIFEEQVTCLSVTVFPARDLTEGPSPCDFVTCIISPRHLQAIPGTVLTSPAKECDQPYKWRGRWGFWAHEVCLTSASRGLSPRAEAPRCSQGPGPGVDKPLILGQGHVFNTFPGGDATKYPQVGRTAWRFEMFF